MKLTLKKNWLLFVCLVVWVPSFSQIQIKVKGPDSISIQITTDTSQKKMIYAYKVNLKDNRVDTVAFPLVKTKQPAPRDSAAFYRTIRNYIKTDSLKRMLEDTVRKYLAIKHDFKITISDTIASSATTSSIPVNFPENAQPVEKSWLEILLNTTPILIAFVLLITGIVVLVLLLCKKMAKQTSSIVLPEELVKIFPGVKKDQGVEPTVKKIREIYLAKEQELATQKENNERVDKLMKALEGERNEFKTELSVSNQALQSKQEEINKNKKENESFTGTAEKILDKYIRDLAIVLEQNQIKDEQEIYRLILTRLITFSMHSASILKKQIKGATELDSLNIQLLNGEQPRPKDAITENTQFGHADPLAYYIYQLLRKHQIEELQDVFVNGYKIGN